MALGDDRRTVTIRNNHKDHRKIIRRRQQVKASIVVIVIAVLLICGIYFRVDEKAVSLFKSFSGSEVTADGGSLFDSIYDRFFSGGSSGQDVTEPEVSEPEDVQEQQAEPEPVPKEVYTSIVVTGDVELSGYVQRNYDASGIDGVVSPELRKKLKSADILEINNEFSFSTRGTQADKQYTFRVDPSYVSILYEMGVDVAGLANNHVLDYGRDALSDTFDTLTNAGIPYIGAGNSLDEASGLVVQEVNGIKVGFLAASRVIPEVGWNVENSQPGVFTCYDTALLVKAISEARPKVDFLVVCVHWGQEHTTNLTDYQPGNGHEYIDAGADVVIGAHPHVLQGIEFYNGKPIFYSLGNFIFNETIDRTAAVKITLDSDGNVKKYRLIPAYAGSATTALAEGDKAAEIYSYMESISSNAAVSADGVVSEKQ